MVGVADPSAVYPVAACCRVPRRAGIWALATGDAARRLGAGLRIALNRDNPV